MSRLQQRVDAHKIFSANVVQACDPEHVLNLQKHLGNDASWVAWEVAGGNLRMGCAICRDLCPAASQELDHPLVCAGPPNFGVMADIKSPTSLESIQTRYNQKSGFIFQAHQAWFESLQIQDAMSLIDRIYITLITLLPFSYLGDA